jgi:enoyl-CoA hydratase
VSGVRSDRDGPVAIVTIDRPAVRNAVDGAAAAALAEAFRRFDADPDLAVAVLTGAGGTFCAGADLHALAAGRGNTVSESGDGPMGPTRMLLSKPVIAAVEGFAVAGGLELALWCDLRVATPSARFGFTERRFGVPLIDGGTQRLPRIAGFRRAMELIVTGRVIDAAEAQQIGLVNEVVPSGTCVTRAVELAHEIAALPQPAIRTDKEAAVRGFGRPLDEGLRIEAQCFNRSIASPETLEGLRQFNERDHPDRRADGEPSTPGLARRR